MKIGKEVWIGKHKLTINKIVPKEGSDQFIGRLNKRTLTIDINTQYTPSIQAECLIHELVHAISLIYALGLTEHQVSTLAEQFYSTLCPLMERIYGNK